MRIAMWGCPVCCLSFFDAGFPYFFNILFGLLSRPPAHALRHSAFQVRSVFDDCSLKFSLVGQAALSADLITAGRSFERLRHLPT